MELKDFIEETLIQVVEGVKSAQERAKEMNAYISPSGVRTNNGHLRIDIGKISIPLNEIDFEIALTSSDGKENKGGIGVFLGGIGLGGQEKSDIKNVSTTSVKFSVPVLFSFVSIDFQKAIQ